MTDPKLPTREDDLPTETEAEAREFRHAPVPQGPSEEEKSQKLLMLVARCVFLVLLVTVTIMTFASEAERPEDFHPLTLVGLFMAAMAFGVIVLLVDAMTPNKRLSSVVGVFVGIVVGLMLAMAVGVLIDVVADAWALRDDRMVAYRGLIKVIIGIVFCYLGVSVVLTTKDDFRMVIPYVEFAKQVRGVRPMIVDTSVLIDGRIEGFGSTGFLDAPLIVPQFVIDELQMLADSGDKLKRARGRRGLTMLSKLQENPYMDVSLDPTPMSGRSVDHMLLDMAREQNYRILTTDYNLNKVAQIHGVTVLNINDLGNAVKSTAMPGDTMTVEIMKTGESPTQGVGYMPDGTMVVVENAADHIGQTITLTVTNSLQTSAGRMIFGRKIDAGSDHTGDGANGDAGTIAQRIAEAATHQPRSRSSARTTEGESRGTRGESPRNPRR